MATVTPEMPIEKLAVGQEKVIGGFAHLTGIVFFLSQTLPPVLKYRRVLYLAKSKKEADWLRQALLFFQPSVDIEEWTNAAPGAALGVDVLLAYPDSLDTSTVSPRDVRELTFQLAVDTKLAQSNVVERLSLAGYDRVGKKAEQVGTFSVIGDVVDVFGSLNNHFRIQWDYDRIGSIERISQSGDAAAVTSAVTFYPCSLAGKGTYTLLDNVRDRLIIHEEDTPLPTQRAAVLTLSHFVMDGVMATHQRRLPPSSVGLEELFRTVKQFERRWVATQFSDATHKQLKPLAESVSLDVRETTLELEGFTDQERNFCLIGDADVFGAEWVKKHTNTRKSISKTAGAGSPLVLSITPRDYVVHVYHGVARFSGTTVMEVNGMKRDYLILEYAGKDKLYVPAETADRVEKYVGSAHPKVHSLHDATWETAVRHVQKHTLELAQELLKIYAQRELAKARPITPHQELEEQVNAGFPYELTEDQQTGLEAVYADLAKDTPMDRLLCGDVGFGKTEVALRAAVRVLAQGMQVTVLAPTTILVQQHFDTFERRLANTGFNVGLLSRFRTAADQKDTVKRLAAGNVDIVIGTHRILSKDVKFKNLGLVIIDEEQRFGVKQKEVLRKLRSEAHVLTLSATPLPRTLHLALSGVRGISTITTPPPGRLGIESFVTPYDSELVKSAITRELARKGQVYFLHNDVDTIQAKAHELQQWFPAVRIGVGHGQLPESELAGVMHAFDTQQVDILVCSTIIENGLDIPQANTLIVERATNFGLAQLHQLRGRIGRGTTQAYAYFFYHSRDLTDEAKMRLKALEEAQELGVGFELAMRDMEIRGVGSILGKNQHGHAETIGLNYYSRLLSSAVAELKQGKMQPLIRDVPIDIPLSTTIPEDVVPDEGERILLYQQFANIRDEEELRKARHTWEPKAYEFKQLFDLFEIRLLIQSSQIVSIDTNYPNKNNGLPSEKIIIKTMNPIAYGFVEQPFERVDERTVRVYKEDLGEDWVKTLMRWIKQLNDLQQTS